MSPTEMQSVSASMYIQDSEDRDKAKEKYEWQNPSMIK